MFAALQAPGTHLAEAHGDATRNQRRRARQRRVRREERECTPGKHARRKHHLAAVAVGERAAHELRASVAEKEDAQHRALEALVPAELLRHFQDGNRDVGPVRIANKDCYRRQRDDVLPWRGLLMR